MGPTESNHNKDSLDYHTLLCILQQVKKGDFRVRLPEHYLGIEGKIAEALNDVIAANENLAEQFTDIGNLIGGQGKTSARLARTGLSGSWLQNVDSINTILDDLTGHSDDIAKVVAAVSRGDLTQLIDVSAIDKPLVGDFARHAKVVNGMVEQLDLFGSEVTRVAREVGVEGKLGAQAKIKGVSGTWKELTDNVNLMADNLTNQVRDIAQVTTAVAQGDLTKKISVEVRGEILELKNTINVMVDQLGSFADEVTRVAREVGTEGVLGGQANVKGVSGTWRDLTNNVNLMAENLTNQVRNIAQVTTAVAQGDLTKTIAVDAQGEVLQLKNTINTMVEQLGAFADEVTRVARDVGTEGVLGGQADVKGAQGIWADLTSNVNSMANNLTGQVRNIAEVATAIAEGDLSKKITVDAKGEILTLKNTINVMVDRLQSFQGEVSRVARLVGTEGTLGVEAEVPDVSGVWKELTDNVNQMALNLTNQVRNIAEVTTAVANGDLSRKITVEVKGEILELKNTINTMVDSLNAFASEVTRMAKEVGTDGILGGQAVVRDVSGIWKELTDNVNIMANNLTQQVRNIAEVSNAVANGDLSKKITVDAQGEILTLKDTVNTMVDQLSSFGAEVTRVARDVGVEGKLGGQATVEGVQGLWRELTENVNTMAQNLTDQVRDIAEVTTAVAKGDLSRKIAVEAKGEILELKSTINTMVDQLSGFAAEVTRLAREVGVEGKLGGQADVRGVAGTWRDLTDNVNLMATNLTDQVRNVSQVATAIAQGDLEKKIVVQAKGEVLTLKNTINTMVDQLKSFAEEVTRVAREVGTEGKLGGQARVDGVAGTWRDLTGNVNRMASNLTDQVRDIAKVTTAVASGDLTQKISVEVRGEILELKDTINTMVDQLSSFAQEVTRVARDVGVEGKLGGQADVRGVAGTWRELTDNVNLMASNLTLQVRDIAQVTTAVAQGDLSKLITVEVKGEIFELKNTINTMVTQLRSFGDEVTRVAREVGTDGVLGGQARVGGVSGIWADLTENVNTMARNLTEQVRGIAAVVTSVAKGDLKKTLVLEAKGEIATLAQTINDMILTLSTFADQVTSVARDVGIEGKLGGQADVPGAAGIWRNLTDNVNELASNLTIQVRAIGDVATAVTKGDLTRTIDVEARGEVAFLKDNINQMIGTLSETTRVNQEQDWLKTNLTKFNRLLQGQRDLLTVTKLALSELSNVIGAQHGVFFMAQHNRSDLILKLYSSYAYKSRKSLSNQFALGEGIVGQCALEKKRILLTAVSPDYIEISSGLGSLPPVNIVAVPILFEDEVKGVVELASFDRFTDIQLSFLEQLFESLGILISSIQASARTEELLKQSQVLSEELQTQQEELRQTNEELEEKARLVTQQNAEVERKNQQVEATKKALEEKAEQLALTSKYKNEFLANMSHELRTPLNSLLILAQQLCDNTDKNLSGKEVEYAQTIYSSGTDLLELINEVLDLAKIESGTMDIDLSLVHLPQLRDYMERTFREIAAKKGLEYSINIVPGSPENIYTDNRRLQQILRNLLSNAFKFTETGSVRVSISLVDEAFVPKTDILNEHKEILAIAVADTGIGIPKERQSLIFEAFQQIDSGANRKYQGTGLGLSISREIAVMLGGELHLQSELGLGATFTLYIPTIVSTNPTKSKQKREVRDSAEKLPSWSMSSDLPPKTNIDLVSAALEDDRGVLSENDKTLLVIDDDVKFAAVILDQARERGFKVITATNGEEGWLLAQRYLPDAITLDLNLPDMHGWVVLDKLKHDPNLRHVPVHIISVDEGIDRSIRYGAIAHVKKPVSIEILRENIDNIYSFVDQDVRHLLIVEDDDVQRKAVVELIGNGDVQSTAVATGKGAIEALEKRKFDCIVIDLSLPDMDGLELIHYIRDSEQFRMIPIVVYTGRELTRQQAFQLEKLTDSVIVKDVKSPERLLDETVLFLHRVETNLPQAKQEMIRRVYHQDPALEGKRILIVDDDMRNIFATTSMLERHNVNVLSAENAIDGIKILEDNAVDLVLMDIMMPEMDGYEAIRRIREKEAFEDLPIIALTAKAMKGDREGCIQAGASDYITKPVDTEQLKSLLRVWLYR